MKRIAYLTLSVLAVISGGVVFSSCDSTHSTDQSHLIYFGITEPYAKVGGIAFTINQLTREITNDDPIPGNVDLKSVKPWFATNDGSLQVKVKGVLQTSGVTKQDLSSPVEYVVESPEGSIKYTVNLTQSSTTQTQVGIKLIKASPLLVNDIESEKETWLSDKARFTELVFKTAEDLKWRLSVIEADLSDGALSLRPLLPEGLTEAPQEGLEWPVATVMEQAKSAAGKGTKVLAAVSADYAMSGTNAPEGGLIIDGKPWKSSFKTDNGNYYFGLRTDGRLSIGSGPTFLALMEKLSQAVSGRELLLDSGAAPSGLNKTSRAPRIVAGMDSYDLKTLYLVSLDVVGSSSGCTLAEMAELMLDLGAAHAVCLLGGDKAQFVVKDGSDLRAVNTEESNFVPVVNSLALVLK